MAQPPSTSPRGRPAAVDTGALASGIRAGDRASLARAITLIESKRADHRADAHRLVQELLPASGKAVRLGITGAPGAGKSTTIDALGAYLTEHGPKVAVLAVDPSSSRSGGSILGDKTRMARLAVDAHAFIRPSPSSGTLGGVAAKTRETMLLCEAAGYDVVIVETVGVGQSETAVSDMTDFFLLLMVAGAGDELQGLKKGVVELADMIAVNKADGDNVERARVAAADFRGALNILTPASATWSPPVITYSALTGNGIPDLWSKVLEHKEKLGATGELAERRRAQQVKWMWTMLEERLTQRLRSDPAVRAKLKSAETAVAAGTLAPTLAVEEIAGLLGL
ncbi:MAG TPA: methylmalonyl Co-A mutase-associated GTPase MeaB [Ideonella sp.]|nr:methylmalonyl Co-A mutase-associated GTPase MeaB [Ideonella sp.]